MNAGQWILPLVCYGTRLPRQDFDPSPHTTLKDVIQGNIFAAIYILILPSLSFLFLTAGLAKNFHQESQCPIFDKSEERQIHYQHLIPSNPNYESQEGQS